MKRHHAILAASAALFLGATAASADCREELAQLESGVSKDGGLAPLQETTDATPQTGGGEAAGTEAGAEGEGVAKDGSTTPLETDPAIATSGQDAQAQQAGGETAAAQASGEGGSPQDDAMARAHAALEAGDEEGCMAALEEARGS
jgi:hypothetical protein